MRPGETYYASPECIDRILSESKPAEEITVKITLDGATDLMEQLTDVAEAFDEMTEAAAEASNIDLEILKETSVFEAEIGDGMKFKGTKSDFKAYIEGVERITKTSIGLTSLLEK
ncbi:hypothetical protein CHCC14819_0465 [Bacillus licheniformis]|nr:hypothetical protein CHCC14819_0465 [Bacillus licheniformis]